MAILIVPPLDLSYPTLGPDLADFIEDRCIFGPGSLAGRPAVLDDEKRAALYRLYEVYPQGHRLAGRRRFQRGALEWRKGTAKTEFASWVIFCELHPEAPVRCDGFDAGGNPVGRPVAFPYIPMMAHTQEQVSKLAYGALKYVVEEGPDSGMFDSSLERIIRIGEHGQLDGQAVPVSNSPGSLDGALTTCQHFDEPHRLYLPSAKNAHETMDANLGKRAMEDPWTFYTSTAGEPGQHSIQEGVRTEAEMIDRGEIEDPALFFFARWAGPEHDDLSTIDLRVAAISDATGPAGEYGPGQFETIAKKWDRPQADKKYLERVWLNRWTKSDAQAFDFNRWVELRDSEPIPDGAFVTAGFDGARFRDATGIVLTDIATGKQMLFAGWERPVDAPDDWEIPEAEVTAAWVEIIRRFRLWKCFGDPPHWTETFGSWAARWPDQFEEWWTARPAYMSRAVRAYREAQMSGAVTHYFQDGDELCEAFERHIAAAGRKDLRWLDDDGSKLFVLKKIHPDRKFDHAMAGCLSWTAYLEAIKTGATDTSGDMFVPTRIR